MPSKLMEFNYYWFHILNGLYFMCEKLWNLRTPRNPIESSPFWGWLTQVIPLHYPQGYPRLYPYTTPRITLGYTPTLHLGLPQVISLRYTEQPAPEYHLGRSQKSFLPFQPGPLWIHLLLRPLITYKIITYKSSMHN